MEEGVESHAVFHQFGEGAEIDDFECVNARGIADDRENRRRRIACQDTHDERDQFQHFFAVAGAEHRYRQSDQSAEYG